MCPQTPDTKKIKDDLGRQRLRFIKASLQQRITAAKCLIQDPKYRSVRLVVLISSIEAVGRSICLKLINPAESNLGNEYQKIRNSNSTKLICLIHQMLKKDRPSKVLGTDWRYLVLANEWRDLIVHEATFMGQDKECLLESARQIFNYLCRLSQTLNEKRKAPVAKNGGAGSAGIEKDSGRVKHE